MANAEKYESLEISEPLMDTSDKTGAMAGEVTVPCVTDRGASDRICGYRARTEVFHSGDNSGLSDVMFTCCQGY